jgi:hypothetical protein
MGTTSPCGEVWNTARQNAMPWPIAVGSSSMSTSRPAVDADEVRVGHPDHVDASCAQGLDDLGHPLLIALESHVRLQANSFGTKQ